MEGVKAAAKVRDDDDDDDDDDDEIDAIKPWFNPLLVCLAARAARLPLLWPAARADDLEGGAQLLLRIADCLSIASLFERGKRERKEGLKINFFSVKIYKAVERASEKRKNEKKWKKKINPLPLFPSLPPRGAPRAPCCCRGPWRAEQRHRRLSLKSPLLRRRRS